MTDRAAAFVGYLMAVLFTAYGAYLVWTGLETFSIINLSAACFGALCSASILESSLFLWSK